MNQIGARFFVDCQANLKTGRTTAPALSPWCIYLKEKHMSNAWSLSSFLSEEPLLRYISIQFQGTWESIHQIYSHTVHVSNNSVCNPKSSLARTVYLGGFITQHLLKVKDLAGAPSVCLARAAGNKDLLMSTSQSSMQEWRWYGAQTR